MITLILIFLSGCIETKVYLGREDPGDENDQVYGAVNPTTIPAGITWGTFRAYINENFEEVDLAIDTLDNGLADAVDSIAAHRTAIQLRLLKSDSTIFASQHDLATGLAGKQDTFTLKTVNGASLIGSGDITIEGGAGGTWGGITGTLADQEDLADALASKQDTSFRLSAIASLADGSGQLTNDGSGNYSWAATGGTGTVTSVGITVPTGFTVTNSPITTNGNLSLGFTSGYSLPMTADQVNWSTAYDWVNSNGLLSISGSHSLLFRTTGATDITLPVSGTIPNQQDVYDAIDNALASALSSAEPALAQSDTVDKIVTKTFLETRLSEFTPSGAFDTTYLHYRVDSLITVIDGLNTEIENLWNAIETLGNFDLTAPAFLSAELGSFADDTLVVLLDTTDVRQDSVPPLTSFTLWAGGTEHGIASVDINYDTLFIALDSAGVYGTVYTLDYTRGTPALQDSTGNKTASWIGRSVTNSFEEPEAGVPTFLTSDGYTWSWLEAQAANLTLNGSQITAVNDKGSGNHDWTGNGTPGAQWDAVNEEIDFANGSSANLELATSPSSLPVTIYMVVRVTDWADGRALMYFTVPTARISQGGGTNQLLLYAGQYNLFADYTNGEYAVITATLNGATSSIQWNDDTPVTGNAGANGISGIYLGYYQDNANFSTKEVIVRNTSDSAQNKTDVKAYLYSKYSITP